MIYAEGESFSHTTQEPKLNAASVGYPLQLVSSHTAFRGCGQLTNSRKCLRVHRHGVKPYLVG